MHWFYVHILLNMLVISQPIKIYHSKGILINQSSIHLLSHGLDRIDQTAADSAHTHEDATHKLKHWAQEDMPIFPWFHMGVLPPMWSCTSLATLATMSITEMQGSLSAQCGTSLTWYISLGTWKVRTYLMGTSFTAMLTCAMPLQVYLGAAFRGTRHGG